MPTEPSDTIPEPERVSLRGVECDRHLLEGVAEEAQEGDTPAAAALRRVIESPEGIGPLPRSGWRVIEETDTRVTYAALDDERENRWAVCAVAVRDGVWAFHGSGYGVQPEPTRRQRGHGLRLEWTEDEFVCRPGEYPQLSLRLVNERRERWVDHGGGEYWALAKLTDAVTGKAVHSRQGVGIAGTGVSYDLAPGGSVLLPVAVDIGDRGDIAPGTYWIAATVFELALQAPRGLLRVSTE